MIKAIPTFPPRRPLIPSPEDSNDVKILKYALSRDVFALWGDFYRVKQRLEKLLKNLPSKEKEDCSEIIQYVAELTWTASNTEFDQFVKIVEYFATNTRAKEKNQYITISNSLTATWQKIYLARARYLRDIKKIQRNRLKDFNSEHLFEDLIEPSESLKRLHSISIKYQPLLSDYLPYAR